jgi:hypothetical protein
MKKCICLEHLKTGQACRARDGMLNVFNRFQIFSITAFIVVSPCISKIRNVNAVQQSNTGIIGSYRVK